MAVPPNNPFSPDFGEAPPVLVGRERLLDNLKTGIFGGPGNREFTTLLLGVRGSGKTVLLQHLRDVAEADGWIVVAVSGSTGNLQDQIIESIDKARATYEAIDGSTDNESRVAAFRLAGVGLSWTRPDQPKRSAGWQLQELAKNARDSGTSVLLSVDELQGVDRSQARELARDIQDIVKLEHLPMGFVGAGLPELQYTLLQDKKITFLQRCHRLHVPPLTRLEAMIGLEQPISIHGGSINPDALRLAADSVGSSPYRLQATGHACWAIAGAPARSIEQWMVQEAISEAESLTTENIHRPAWHELSERDQTYISVVSQLGDNATPAAIANNTQLPSRRLADCERRLTLSGYVTRQQNTVCLTDLVSVAVINEYTSTEADYASGDPTPPVPPRSPHRCGHYMPRARTKCVLSRGHKGGHRSRL